MSEYRVGIPEEQSTPEHETFGLLDTLGEVDAKRVTVWRVASELNIPAAQYKIDTIRYDYGPEGVIKANIDTLAGYIAVVQAQLLSIENKIERIESEKKEPQQVYKETVRILEAIEERKIQIIQKMRELELERRSVETQKLLQDLKREKDVTGEDDRRLASDGKLHATHEILRLNKTLALMTAEKNTRVDMLGDYASAVDGLRIEVDKAESALTEVIASIDAMIAIADDGARHLPIPRPEQLPDHLGHGATRPASYGEYTLTREGDMSEPALSAAKLPDDASSLPDQLATVSVEIPYTFEQPSAAEPKRSLEEVLRQARAKSAKPTKHGKKSRPWKRMGV